MTWTPTPGTIPALALAHLRTRPPGTKLSTAALAEAIGHESSGLTAYLKPARDLGMITAELDPNLRTLFWWLPVEEEPVDPDKPIGDSIPKAKPEVAKKRNSATSLTPTSRPKEINMPRVEHSPVPAQAASVPPEDDVTMLPGVMNPVVINRPGTPAGTSTARWGILSDGELHIQKGGSHVELERFEFEALVDFLKRTGGEVGS